MTSRAATETCVHRATCSPSPPLRTLSTGRSTRRKRRFLARSSTAQRQEGRRAPQPYRAFHSRVPPVRQGAGHYGRVGSVRHLACALLAIALLAACGGNERGQVEASRLPAELLTIHPVLGELPSPCSSPSPDGHLVAGPAEDGKITGCLVLGPPEIDARALRTVVVQEASSETTLDIAVRLNAQSTDRFTNLAGRSIGRRLAIVTEGRLLAAPIVESISTEGRFIISGIPRERAVELVRRLGGDAAVPKASAEPNAVRRATKLCEGYVATLGQGAEVGMVLARTAGDVTRVSRQFLGRTTPPWDSLPADHFVAGCSYTFPITSSTKRCRGGEIVPAGGAVLLDDEGRMTPDPTADLAAPC